VVYGLVGFKDTCQIIASIRQEIEGIRRYCHIGTGNYHPKTARSYEDLGLLTDDPQMQMMWHTFLIRSLATALMKIMTDY
jgi:polyphosphate kinase